MLTREQILRKMHGFECPMYLLDSNWKPIYDQCVAAIDLAAENERLKEDQRRGNQKIKEVSMAYGKLHRENERLKAKLNEIRAECVKTIEFNGEVGEASEARYILAIIDKDGDEK